MRYGFDPIVYRNLILKTNLTQKQFQMYTGIRLSTLRRRLKNNERFSTRESDAIYRLIVLVILAEKLIGDEEKALKWIQTRVYGLGGKKPLEMLMTTVDFDVLKDLIGRIKHGVIS
ncbi:antitoxin Xre/MbcA/ParS toxin-binding domain-containing protein [Vibrio sp. F74]|uniref:type II RES/Xre toxin-antitoxin system antitoxin n=1 Tax=Vibrio sp. F74 TaxID=700020 RepID=UPI0035F5E15B